MVPVAVRIASGVRPEIFSVFFIVRLAESSRRARHSDKAGKDDHGQDIRDNLNVFDSNVRDHALHLQ